MLRFPNPSSSIDNFIKVFKVAFQHLNGGTLTLDDLSGAIVAANLATSSGYMGAEAFRRSTRDDRSRDPLYNQSKSYAELFRLLGWMHSSTDSSLVFNFTLLGKQLEAAGSDYLPLLGECLLGISYPNGVLSAKGQFNLRPFAFILRVMRAAGGYLSRDEMIIGPLSASTDLDSSSLEQVVRSVEASRQSEIAIKEALSSVADSRKIQTNTLSNYTRWPLAVLRETGWTRNETFEYSNHRRYTVRVLTETGLAIAERAETAADLRLTDFNLLNADQRQALILVSHYKMLAKAGFDIDPVENRITAGLQTLETYFRARDIDPDHLLFSPFQTLSPSVTEEVFPRFRTGPSFPAMTVPLPESKESGRDDRAHLFVKPRLIASTEYSSSAAETLRVELFELMNSSESFEKASVAFVEKQAKSTKQTFYPLVTHLFELLGYRTEYSRAGVNYQRWDAAVWIGESAIPVEIKSPSEEMHLSTKAVRQALENKVVLLARGGLETRAELTSLVVGYRLPNERGEMSNLIDDVFAAYGLRLGVIDLHSLVQLVLKSISNKVTIDPKQLSELRGFLYV